MPCTLLFTDSVDKIYVPKFRMTVGCFATRATSLAMTQPDVDSLTAHDKWKYFFAQLTRDVQQKGCCGIALDLETTTETLAWSPGSIISRGAGDDARHIMFTF